MLNTWLDCITLSISAIIFSPDKSSALVNGTQMGISNAGWFSVTRIRSSGLALLFLLVCRRTRRLMALLSVLREIRKQSRHTLKTLYRSFSIFFRSFFHIASSVQSCLSDRLTFSFSWAGKIHSFFQPCPSNYQLNSPFDSL